MEKPITLIISETKNNIAKVINESSLPFFILDNIIKDFYTEIHTIAIQQQEKDRLDYEQSLQNESTTEEKKRKCLK